MPKAPIMKPYRRRSVVGIDIGSNAIRWVEMSLRRGHIVVDSAGTRCLSRPAGETLDDTTTDDPIGEAIHDVIAPDDHPRRTVAVAIGMEFVDFELRHFGTQLTDEELAFHVARHAARGRAVGNDGNGRTHTTRRARRRLLDYRTLGCCPFDPRYLDVLTVTSTDVAIAGLVERFGRHLRCVDVDALVIGRWLAACGLDKPVLVRRRAASDDDPGVLIDVARHGVPVAACRRVGRHAPTTASALGGMTPRNAPDERWRVRELCERDLVERKIGVIARDVDLVNLLDRDFAPLVDSIRPGGAVAAFVAIDELSRRGMRR